MAGFLGLVIPGLGHLLTGRRRTGLLFLIPVVLLASAVAGYYAGGGPTAILAFVVAPGVLPVLIVVNIALAVWRIAAAVDAARTTPKPALAIAILGPAMLALVIVPHLWAGTSMAAFSDLLDSMFASENQPTETEAPIDETIPPDFTFPPDEEDWATDAPEE